MSTPEQTGYSKTRTEYISRNGLFFSRQIILKLGTTRHSTAPPGTLCLRTASKPPGGGGGVLSLFFMRRLGPSIYRSPPPPKKKISGISNTQKIFEIFCHPKIPPFCTLTLRKGTKVHRNDPKIHTSFVMTQNKYPQNLHTPKNIHFSENPQRY